MLYRCSELRHGVSIGPRIRSSSPDPVIQTLNDLSASKDTSSSSCYGYDIVPHLLQLRLHCRADAVLDEDICVAAFILVHLGCDAEARGVESCLRIVAFEEHVEQHLNMSLWQDVNMSFTSSDFSI